MNVVNSTAKYVILPNGARIDLDGFVFATFPAGTELHDMPHKMTLAAQSIVNFSAALSELDFPMLLRVLGVEDIDKSYHGGERLRSSKSHHGRWPKLDRRLKRRPIWKLTARRR